MTDAQRLHRQLYVLTEVAKTLTLPLELPEFLNAVIKKIIGVIEPAEAWNSDVMGSTRRDFCARRLLLVTISSHSASWN